jgi:fructokinase
MTELFRPTICLGEAIVDLIGAGTPSRSRAAAPLVPHPGGALANVAVAIAREGRPVDLVGGVGDDHWGAWLAGNLGDEGVGTDRLSRVSGLDSPIAVIFFDETGEPHFQVYGEAIGPLMKAARPHLPESIPDAGAIVIGANTMVGEIERTVTREAVELALGAGVPVVLDPNHRPGRWADQDDARRLTLELVQAATVIKANRHEAEFLTGRSGSREAAEALLELGPSLAVITDGPGAVTVAGETEVTVYPDEVDVVSPLGAGDAFLGGLVAGLDEAGWNLGDAVVPVENACRAAALACRTIGAHS